MLSDRENRLSGYMTVEASFIVPWSVFIIVWLIYLGFFEYNRCRLFQEDYALAVQTAVQICPLTDQKTWMNSHIGENAEKRYLAAKNLSTSGEVSRSNIKITSQLKTVPAISSQTGLIPEGRWKISDTVNAENFSYSRRLRTFRAAGRILDGGK